MLCAAVQDIQYLREDEVDIDENDDMEDFGVDFSDDDGEEDSERGSSSGENEVQLPCWNLCAT